MTEEEDIAKGMEEVPRIRACKHNWVEDGSVPERGEYRYRCTRCGARGSVL